MLPMLSLPSLVSSISIILRTDSLRTNDDDAGKASEASKGHYGRSGLSDSDSEEEEVSARLGWKWWVSHDLMDVKGERQGRRGDGGTG